MVVTTHQPIFLPWPGFFFKAMKADCMVLLDDVQYPRGRSWINRNRLKNEQGVLWLTVPVHKKGRGLQIIHKVEIFNEIDWRKKHLRSIQQNYVHAPFFNYYFPILESIYTQKYRVLIKLNMKLIHFLWDELKLRTELKLQSDLGIKGKGTKLLINICKELQADHYLIFPVVQKYLDLEEMRQNGIQAKFANFHPPIYPQLWSDFIYNLSTLDLLLNCGPKSSEIISKA